MPTRKDRPPLPDEFSAKDYAAARRDLVSMLTSIGEEKPVSVSSIRRGSDVPRHTTKYIWNPYLPLGELVALAGEGDSGKTWLALMLAAVVQLGTAAKLPKDPKRKSRKRTAGSSLSRPADVLLLQRENSEGSTILPRFEELGGDADALVLPDEVFRFGHKDEPSHLEGFFRLAWYIEATGAKFVFIDPLTGFIEASMKDARQVRVVLERLQAVARFTGCTIAYVLHLNKDYAAPSIVHRIMYSAEFVNVPRSVLVAQQDPEAGEGEDISNHVFHHEKNNLGQKGGPVGYTIIGDTDKKGTLRFLWRDVDQERGSSEVSTILNGEPDDWQTLTKPEKVRAELLRLLTLTDRPVWNSILKADIEASLGFEVTNGTWKRARDSFIFKTYEAESGDIVTDKGPGWDEVPGSGKWAFRPVAEVLLPGPAIPIPAPAEF